MAKIIFYVSLIISGVSAIGIFVCLYLIAHGVYKIEMINVASFGAIFACSLFLSGITAIISLLFFAFPNCFYFGKDKTE